MPHPDPRPDPDPLSGQVLEWHAPPEPVDPARILRVHRYRDPATVRPIIAEAARQAAQEARRLATVTARYVAKPIRCIDSQGLILADGTRFSCPAFERHLAGCRYLIAFLVTIGPDLDDTVITLINDRFEPLDALFLETAGWLTIETATRAFTSQIRPALARRGYTISLRMGPGYDYAIPGTDTRTRWNLEEQKYLFDMFQNANLPVTLMHSSAMQPKMSRSGVFGLRTIQ